MADVSIRNGNGFGLLITPDLIPSFPIVCYFSEVPLVIEEDVAAEAAAAPVDLAAFYQDDVAVLVAPAIHCFVGLAILADSASHH